MPPVPIAAINYKSWVKVFRASRGGRFPCSVGALQFTRSCRAVRYVPLASRPSPHALGEPTALGRIPRRLSSASPAGSDPWPTKSSDDQPAGLGIIPQMLKQILGKWTAAPVIGAIAISVGGCAATNQAESARNAIPADQVPGIKEPHSIAYTWGPEQPREFADIQAVPFVVVSHDGKVATNVYAVEGKDKTGSWHVLYAAKREGDRWVPVQLSSPPQSDTAGVSAR